jgi:hypothetical protein
VNQKQSNTNAVCLFEEEQWRRFGPVRVAAWPEATLSFERE